MNKDEISNLIWEYCNESSESEYGFEPKYVKEKMMEEHKIEVVSIHTGGFDSSGYSISCYAFGFICDGKVELVDHQEIFE